MARLKMHGWGQLILSICCFSRISFGLQNPDRHFLTRQSALAGMPQWVAADTRRDQGPQYVDCLDWWQ